MAEYKDGIEAPIVSDESYPIGCGAGATGRVDASKPNESAPPRTLRPVDVTDAHLLILWEEVEMLIAYYNRAAHVGIHDPRLVTFISEVTDEHFGGCVHKYPDGRIYAVKR